jgi:hypothetical protein
MFTEVHLKNDDSGQKLAFINSLNVQAFPCGRRRSEQITSADDKYYIPYDPEARLNTEKNNSNRFITGYVLCPHCLWRFYYLL